MLGRRWGEGGWWCIVKNGEREAGGLWLKVGRGRQVVHG